MWLFLAQTAQNELRSSFERYWFGPQGGGCFKPLKHKTGEPESVCILQEAPCSNGSLDEKFHFFWTPLMTPQHSVPTGMVMFLGGCAHGQRLAASSVA